MWKLLKRNYDAKMEKLKKKEKSENQPGRDSHILFSNFAMNANSLPEGQRSISA